jgi:hypothetical protein
MNIKRKKIINYLIVFWGLSLIFFTACNQVKEDDFPDPTEDNLDVEALTTPESPTVINLLNNQSFGTETEFELLTSTETAGAAQFIGRGLMLYTPKETATEGTDKVRFRTRSGKDKPWQENEIKVIIVVKPDDLPCRLGARPDFAFIPPTEPSLVIDVLANDRFCNNRPDSSSLQIAIQPLLGKAEIVQPAGGRPKVRYTRNQNNPTTANRDVFVYKIHELNKPDNVAYGVVVVNFGQGQGCRLKAEDDLLTMSRKDTNRKVIPVLRNDFFCPELVKWDEFRVVRPPKYGVAFVTNDHKIIFKSSVPSLNMNPLPEKDEFRYHIKYKDGRVDTAKVLIIYQDSLVCPAVLPQANDDKYRFRGDTMQIGKLNLPVLANDRFCPPAFNPAKFIITQRPGVGQAVVLNGFIQFVPPTTNWRGRVKFKYQICENNNNCDDAEVEVEIE